MSYTTKIKNEAATVDITTSEIVAELSGFIRNNMVIRENNITLSSENKTIIDRMNKYIEDIFKITPKIEIRNSTNFSKRDLYFLLVPYNKDILTTVGYSENEVYLDTPPEYIVGGNEEIRAYLRGVFFHSGSINDPKTSRYHMEILVLEPEEAIFVQKLLNIFDLNAKILNRDKGYMIYIKEADKISDFIKIIGASGAVLYFENVRIYRDKKNKTNRLNNCEQANTDKIILSATKQLDDIKLIEETASISLLDEKEVIVLNYRKKYPEISLKDLAQIISLETTKSITKSGLNHRLHKITNLAERIRKNLKEIENIHN